MKPSERSRPHVNTRNAHKLETTEDYLEAIADVVATKAVCRSADLAKRFAVSPVTVHKIVERLRLLSLVTGEPYQPIELTAEGMEIAGKAKERHQIVFEFLVAIGIDEATAAIDSEGIEHHVSPKTLEKLKQFSLRKIGAQ